ncbi:MAG TPA: hypothetical protein HA263_09800 [Methanoregulaceae archaeon]|nr:hypothetical protein [Methanoregulaceae archaeon]
MRCSVGREAKREKRRVGGGVGPLADPDEQYSRVIGVLDEALRLFQSAPAVPALPDDAAVGGESRRHPLLARDETGRVGQGRRAGHGRDRDVGVGVTRYTAASDKPAVGEAQERLRLRDPGGARPDDPASVVEPDDRAVPGEHGGASIADRHDRPCNVGTFGDEPVPLDRTVGRKPDEPGAGRVARVAPVLRGDREPATRELDQVLGAVVLAGVDGLRPLRHAVGVQLEDHDVPVGNRVGAADAARRDDEQQHQHGQNCQIPHPQFCNHRRLSHSSSGIPVIVA